MCATLLAATTFYYRRKFRRLHDKYHHKKVTDPPKEKKTRYSRKAKQDSSSESKSDSDPNQVFFDVGEIVKLGQSDLYHEQYNEHGVKIEPELSEAELIQHYVLK